MWSFKKPKDHHEWCHGKWKNPIQFILQSSFDWYSDVLMFNNLKYKVKGFSQNQVDEIINSDDPEMMSSMLEHVEAEESLKFRLYRIKITVFAFVKYVVTARFLKKPFKECV